MFQPNHSHIAEWFLELSNMYNLICLIWNQNSFFFVGLQIKSDLKNMTRVHSRKGITKQISKEKLLPASHSEGKLSIYVWSLFLGGSGILKRNGLEKSPLM